MAAFGRPPAVVATLDHRAGCFVGNRRAAVVRGALTMPGGSSDWVDVLLFIIAGAGLIIVLGGGAFQALRRWSDNRRIRKHLRQ